MGGKFTGIDGMKDTISDGTQMPSITDVIPVVIEQTGKGERSFDIFSRLLRERIVFLTGEVEDYMSTIICSQLLFLESENSKSDIYLYINSPGGVVSAGLAIYDTMQFISCNVVTVCIGQACSMGSLLLAGGAAGKRFCLPHSRVMIHQPSGGFRGQASDIQIHAQEIAYLKKTLNNIYARHTGQKVSAIESAMDRDNFMSVDQAKKFGIIDEVISSRAGMSKLFQKKK